MNKQRFKGEAGAAVQDLRVCGWLRYTLSGPKCSTQRERERERERERLYTTHKKRRM